MKKKIQWQSCNLKHIEKKLNENENRLKIDRKRYESSKSERRKKTCDSHWQVFSKQGRELLRHAARVAAGFRVAPRHHRAPVGQQRESAAIFARENLRRAVAELEDQLVYGAIDIVAALQGTVNRTCTKPLQL